MASIQVGSIISEAWSLTKKNLILILFVVVVASIGTAFQPSGLPEGVSSMDLLEKMKSGDMQSVQEITNQMNDNRFNSPASILMYILSIVVSSVLGVGLVNTFIQIAKGKMTSISLSAFALPVSVYVKAVITSLITGILCGLSALLCVIPMFYIAPKIMFAYLYIIDGRTDSITEAIKMSWKDTEGEVGSLILLYIAVIGIVILGLICCCCGILVSEVVSYFAFVLAYLTIAQDRPELNATSTNTEITETV